MRLRTRLGKSLPCLFEFLVALAANLLNDLAGSRTDVLDHLADTFAGLARKRSRPAGHALGYLARAGASGTQPGCRSLANW